IRFFHVTGVQTCALPIWLGFGLYFGDRADHVEGALRVVLKLSAKNAFASVECVLEADELALETGEGLDREEWLGEEAIQPANPRSEERRAAEQGRELISI